MNDKRIEAVEEKTGTKQHIMKLEDVPGCETEKRALEVALAGGHSLAILFNTGSYAPQLIRAGVRIAQDIPVPFHGIAHPWCPCGNYGSPKQECRCSPRTIEKHLTKLGKRMDDFTIWVGASIPLSRQLHIKGEPEAAILKRIRTARANAEPSNDLDASCRELIACYRRQMTVDVAVDINKVTSVATSIARLDNSREILMQHLAEALQYQPHVLQGFSACLKQQTVEVECG